MAWVLRAPKAQRRRGTKSKTVAADRHAARTTVGGMARYGEQRTRTQDRRRGRRTKKSHDAHTCTREGGKTEERPERKAEKFLLQRLRVEKQRPEREAPLLMPIVAPPGNSFPGDFPTPKIRAVSCGFPPRPSSVWLPAVFLHTPVTRRRCGGKTGSSHHYTRKRRIPRIEVDCICGS